MRSTYSPCLPTNGKIVPATSNWLHEIKYDAYRPIVAPRRKSRARAFAVNPARLRRAPCGLRRLTAGEIYS
jgi:hypothetical protein